LDISLDVLLMDRMV